MGLTRSSNVDGFGYVTADGGMGLSRMGVVWGAASRRTLLVSRLSLSLSCLFLSFFLFSFFFSFIFGFSIWFWSLQLNAGFPSFFLFSFFLLFFF